MTPWFLWQMRHRLKSSHGTNRYYAKAAMAFDFKKEYKETINVRLIEPYE